MIPTILGKKIYECDENEIKEIIDNPVFRESEYLDYKTDFSIFKIANKEEKQKAIYEFRNDICSFANTHEGLLIYGIKEEKGIPKTISGITINKNNTDKFELLIRDYLSSIEPRIPFVKLFFIPLSEENKYLVMIYIKRDTFAPYIHVENESNYKVYKRYGNKKAIMSYAELKNMFIQSITLEEKIDEYRNKRIEHFKSNIDDNTSCSKFLLFHIIPETFFDKSYNKIMFLELRKNINFADLFEAFGILRVSQLTVDGLRYISNWNKNECLLLNNGVAEVFYPLDEYTRDNFFPWLDMWNKIERTITSYSKSMKKHIDTSNIIICLSIIGCKNVNTKTNNEFDKNYVIDRNNLIIPSIVFEHIDNQDQLIINLKNYKLQYAFSLGIKKDHNINSLIEEIIKER